MKMTEHLDSIEKLAIARSSPAKIRSHILAMREQVEAFEKDAKKIAIYKKQIAVLKAENMKLKQPVMKSRFRRSDPAAHVLRALALLGEGAYTAAQVAQKANEPIMKVRHLLENLRLLDNVVLTQGAGKREKRYKLNREQLDDLIEQGIL